ncbi:hypothetical protein IWZ00DRAFT_519465, partial [Phyllosticta capitalensis]
MLCLCNCCFGFVSIADIVVAVDRKRTAAVVHDKCGKHVPNGSIDSKNRCFWLQRPTSCFDGHAAGGCRGVSIANAIFPTNHTK